MIGVDQSGQGCRALVSSWSPTIGNELAKIELSGATAVWVQGDKGLGVLNAVCILTS